MRSVIGSQPQIMSHGSGTDCEVVTVRHGSKTHMKRQQRHQAGSTMALGVYRSAWEVLVKVAFPALSVLDVHVRQPCRGSLEHFEGRTLRVVRKMSEALSRKAWGAMNMRLETGLQTRRGGLAV